MYETAVMVVHASGHANVGLVVIAVVVVVVLSLLFRGIK